MTGIFSTTKKKILLFVNVVVILLYFVFDIASIALFVSPEFNVLWKFISIIIPWIIIYFTAPRANNGNKITVSLWGAALIVYYFVHGNIQIRGNEYGHYIAGTKLMTDEIYFNMVLSIFLSVLVLVSGLGIIYRIRRENKCNRACNLSFQKQSKMENKKSIFTEEYMAQFCPNCGFKHIDGSVFCGKCGTEVLRIIRDRIEFPVCIFDMSTHTLRKENREIDTKKFSPAHYSKDNTYYAIETIKNGKKVRVYHTKDSWSKQIEEGI